MFLHVPFSTTCIIIFRAGDFFKLPCTWRADVGVGVDAWKSSSVVLPSQVVVRKTTMPGSLRACMHTLPGYSRIHTQRSRATNADDFMRYSFPKKTTQVCRKCSSALMSWVEKTTACSDSLALRDVQLTVLTFGWRIDKFAHVILPHFVGELCDFTPISWLKFWHIL
jgi:hypothetical protein